MIWVGYLGCMGEMRNAYRMPANFRKCGTWQAVRFKREGREYVDGSEVVRDKT
jgi:hypothetical protein